MDIVRGTIKPKKHKEVICGECGRSFISEKNLQKHVSTYHKPGVTGCVTKGKRDKTYICINCAKCYCNKKSLIKHMLECRGNIFNSTLTSI